MIRKNSLFFKLSRIRKSSVSLFQIYMETYNPAQEICPSCHAAGHCIPFSTYRRNLIDLFQGKILIHTILISRCKCQNCGHTHSILPDCIIPYGQYSLLFILKILFKYFFHRQTINSLCQNYQITPAILYRWKNLFLSHAHLWSERIKNMNPSSSTSIFKILFTTDPLSGFLSAFSAAFSLSFLQNHKSPFSDFP